jgi:predicted DCC family thiol-disulfide oxidoreductase YuxK
MPAGKTTVYYDGACPLCRAEIGLYRECRGAEVLELVDASSPDTKLPQGLDRSGALARFHVVTRDGKLVSGAAAFSEIWRQLPAWRWAGRFASLPGATPLLEVFYRGFLVIRPAIVRIFVRLRGDAQPRASSH